MVWSAEPESPAAAKYLPVVSAGFLSLVRGPGSIADLSWLVEKIPLVGIPPEDESEGTIQLQGRFDRPGWELEYSGVVLKRDPEGKFALRVALMSEETKVVLTARSSEAQVEVEEVLIRFPSVEEWRSWESRRQSRSRGVWRFALGAGPDLQSFSWVGKVDFGQLGLKLSPEILFELPGKKWQFSASTSITALSFGGNISGVSFRTWMSRLGARYLFPKEALGLGSAWRFEFEGGIHYSTTFATNNAFGYRNLMSPQLLPRITHDWGNDYSLSCSLFFAPIFSGLGLMGLGNRQMGLELLFKSPLRLDRYPMDISIDYLSQNVQVGDRSPFTLSTFSVSSRLWF